MFLGGGVPLVGPQEELRCPNGYTPRGFTLSPRREVKSGFAGFIITTNKKQTDKQTDKQTNRQTDKQTNRQTDSQSKTSSCFGSVLVVHVACLRMCVLFDFSFVCISAYVYVFKCKVHCGSAVRFGGESMDHLITAHHLYAFLL